MSQKQNRPLYFDLRNALVDWQQKNGRKNLPWQLSPTAYNVWISEIMLQQTQVQKVTSFYNKFILALPSVQALANAPIEQVLALWSGLGYYRRAHNLHSASQIIVKDFNAVMPQSIAALQSLPGIGRSTAGAILSLAYQKPATLLDANAKRVLSRIFAERRTWTTVVEKELWLQADQIALIDDGRARQYSQALMDLGSQICKPKTLAQCHLCPVTQYCSSYKKNIVSSVPKSKTKPTTKRRQFEWHWALPYSAKPNNKDTEYTIGLIKNNTNNMPQQLSKFNIWQDLLVPPNTEKIELSQFTAQKHGTTIWKLTHIDLILTLNLIAIEPKIQQQPPFVDMHWLTLTQAFESAIPSALCNFLVSLQNALLRQ